jgi:hypothetical protein
MSENKQNETLSITDVFNKWQAHILKDGFSRFSYSSREPQLKILAEYLVDYGVSFEDAKALKRQVIAALMTEDGMKKKNKHKNGNWLMNTERDFDAIMADYYIADPVAKTTVKTDYKQKVEIVEWVKTKFGSDVNAQVIREAHQIGNVLNNMYFNDLQKEA